MNLGCQCIFRKKQILYIDFYIDFNITLSLIETSKNNTIARLSLTKYRNFSKRLDAQVLSALQSPHDEQP